MSKNTKIGLAVIIVLIILVVIIKNSNRPANVSEPIKIGFIGPLSGFGAPWGEEQKFAVQTAVDEINKSGGVLGRQFKVYYEDGKCAEKDASTAAQKLISIDKVDLLFAVCGAEALAVAPIANQNKIVTIGLWATNPQLSGISKYVFRNSYSDDDSGRIMAEAVNDKYKSVGIITGLAGYPVGLRDGFKKYYTEKVYSEDYQPGNNDFKTIVTKIIANSPQVVFVNANSQSEAVAILKQLELLRYKGTILMNFFW
jgi:branched-chain amino acid transport system substrate-binding protein